MKPAMPRVVDDIRRGRVRAVSDSGEVSIQLPDGRHRTVTIPIETVPLVRRLAALDREAAEERRRAYRR